METTDNKAQAIIRLFNPEASPEQLDDFFEKAYKGCYYTAIGCGGPETDWTEGYTKMLEDREIGRPEQFFFFSGRQMNEHYSLHGNNKYPDDLSFMAFPTKGLDPGKLAVFKLIANDRWFDDIVDNNAAHERR